MTHTTNDASSPQARRLRRAAGRYLANLRKDAKLTQRRLADLVGLDYYTFISQLECGQGRLPPHLYVKYAKALGIDRQTFGREVIKFYDPWTYSTLFGDHPYDMSFETDTEEERLEATQGCTTK